jgi:uncharacterized MAPEG superfamily protein
MTIELQYLLWSVLLGFVHVVLSGASAARIRGLAWNAGPRDGTPVPLTGVSGRLDRANRNFLETFVFFAAVVLAVVVAGKTSSQTALGVQLYFWARLAYLPTYAAGVPYLRSVVWAVAMVGLGMLVVALA